MTISQRLTAGVLAISLVTTVGCTSMKTIHPSTIPAPPTFENIKEGDTVIVHTRDGQRVRFVVQRVDGDTLIAPDGVRYRASEITQLQRRSFSGGRTALLVGGVVAGVILLLAAAAQAAVLSGL